MREAFGLVESAWFFRRGSQTVRLIRMGHGGSKLSLRVEGPGASRLTHHFDDHMACAIQQCEIERQLAARRFSLESISCPRR